jgi:hypothetical protein
MALFVAKWIEEAVPIISVVADRSGFDLIKSYEEWGMVADGYERQYGGLIVWSLQSIWGE